MVVQNVFTPDPGQKHYDGGGLEVYIYIVFGEIIFEGGVFWIIMTRYTLHSVGNQGTILLDIKLV